MHTVGSDIVVVWVAVIVVGAALALGGACSIQDKEARVIGCYTPLALLAMAVIVTVLQLTGVIGVW